MKAIMISIKPKWVAKILNGEKTLEIRKTCPKNFDGWVYIYCTKDSENIDARVELRKRYGGATYYQPFGRVVARFYLKNVDEIYFTETEWKGAWANTLRHSCLTPEELAKYLNGKGYAWHIENLEIFDKPKELGEFKTCWKKVKGNENEYYRHALTKAPQSWCYVEVGQ